MAPPVSFTELFGDTLVRKTPDGLGTVRTEDALRGKYVGIYFSAHWCPPCRAFTPMLRKFYMRMLALSQTDIGKLEGVSNTPGHPFEVVFVSADHTEQEAQAYYLQNMPWLQLPFADAARRMALNRRYGVMGIPSLIILSPEGKLMCGNARAALIKDPEGTRFPWEGHKDSMGFPLWIPLMLILLLWWAWSTFMQPGAAH